MDEGMIIDRERLESLQKAMIAANLLVILSMFGGTDFGGTWYVSDFDINVSDGEEKWDYGTDLETEGNVKYLLKEVESDVSMEGFYGGLDVDESDRETYDYDDNECDCNDREDVMKNTNNLARLGLIASLALLVIIYQLLKDPENLARQLKLDLYGGTETLVTNVQRLAFVAAGACLLSAGYFALSYPNAWEEDTDNFDTWDEDTAFRGDVKLDHTETEDGITVKVTGDTSFGPGMGWFLIIISGLASAWVAKELKDDFPVQGEMGEPPHPISVPLQVTPPLSFVEKKPAVPSFAKTEPPKTEPVAPKKEPAPDEKKTISKKKTVAKKPPAPKKKEPDAKKPDDSKKKETGQKKKETKYEEPEVSVMAVPEDEGD
jgi:hypothetical protein